MKKQYTGIRARGSMAWLGIIAGVALALLAFLPPGMLAHAQPAPAGPSSNVSVFATGLNNPRGLRFGPDGNLYVAEAGLAGPLSTVGLTRSSYGPCYQAGPEVGPYLGGYTARISRIDAHGARSTVIDNLPSALSRQHGIIGVADIEFVANQMYALLEGAGCSHGTRDVPNGVIRVDPLNQTWTELNLSNWVYTHPVAQPDADDFEPDGNWYSMTTDGTNLYPIDANRGELLRVDFDRATISRVVDTSAVYGHIVPTAVTYHAGNFYVGNLGTFPANPAGGSKIYQITPSGQTSVYASGLTPVVSIAFGPDGNLYALEIFSGSPFPSPSTGQVVRVTPTGNTVVASGLTFPTGMTFGPDGNLYVSNFGSFGPPGSGQVVKVTIPKS